jgi:DNA processing protein
VSGACAACLRRSYLVAHLAPRIAGVLDRPGRRTAPLLALGDGELIAAVAGADAEAAFAHLERFDLAAARRGLAYAAVDAVCRHEDDYPERLGELADPPPVVFLAGSRERLAALTEGPAVALVGTRQPSAYGREVAYALGRGLGAAGVAVVSGLALGIDAVGHRGCLDAGGKAVAVLANGPDIAYPRRHRRLWEELRSRGLVMAELPPGRRALRWSFPARNRIMAGLAEMTVVVEAGEPSGSLITAAFAGDLGRPVGAVPGRVTARMAAGSNGLLRDGARLVTGPEDVLDELYGVGAARAPGPPSAGAPLDAGLRDVLAAVESGAQAEGLARAAGVSPREARAALARLEAAGYLVRDGLGRYERTTLREP